MFCALKVPHSEELDKAKATFTTDDQAEFAHRRQSVCRWQDDAGPSGNNSA